MAADALQFELPPICHSNTRALYEYWRAKCGVRSMPARRDIDPTYMPRLLLPGISLVDVVSDERRYVYRLVGTADVEVRGFDPIGQCVMDGFFGNSVEDVLASYDRVVSSAAPFFDRRSFTAASKRYVTEETIFLPLSDDGVTVNKILVFSQSRDLRTVATARARA